MKIRSISLAAALACVASSSFALTPAQIDVNTVQLWLTGASAPTAAVYGAIRKLCVPNATTGKPNDLHVYLEKTVTAAADASPGKSAAGKLAAYACTMGPLAGTDLNGKKAVIYHTFDIGSFEAYIPHLSLAGEVNDTVTNTARRLKNIAAINPPAPAPAVNTCVLTALATQDPTYLGCGSATVTFAPNASVNAVPTLPVGGLSDTEYTLNKVNLTINTPLADIGSEVSSNVGQGFGLAVSYPLYVEMQKSQGLITATKTDCAATGAGAGITAVNLTPACQPNISRQKYASLVGGGAADKNAGLLASTLAGDAAAIPPVAASPLVVERRVGTSGTQSASNAFFLNAPCATGLPAGAGTVDGINVPTTSVVQDPAFPNDPTKTITIVNNTIAYPGVTIRSNAGSGDVKANITAASTAGTYAIGVISLENSPSATEKFAFVKLNGVTGTPDTTKQRQTAIDGDYEFWYEMVAFTASSAPVEGQNLVTGMVSALADPTVTDLKGLFVTPLSGFTNAAYPTIVSKGYKNGNACSTSVQ